MFKKNGSMTGMQPLLTIIIIILMIFGNHWVVWYSFLIDVELVALDSQLIQSLQMTPSWKLENMNGSLSHENPRSKVHILLKAK